MRRNGTQRVGRCAGWRAVVAAAALAGCASATLRRFPLAEPLWRDDDTRPQARRPREPADTDLWESLDQLTFARVHAALLPGGVFVDADQVLGTSPEDDRARHAAWERAARDLGSDDAEIAAAKERMRLDRCDTASDQIAWLRAAGFADARVVFEDGIFAVMVGAKRAR